MSRPSPISPVRALTRSSRAFMRACPVTTAAANDGASASQRWAPECHPSTFGHVAGHGSAIEVFKEDSDTSGGRVFEHRSDTSRGRPALSDGRMTDAAPNDALRAAALSVMSRAYAPYSHF